MITFVRDSTTADFPTFLVPRTWMLKEAKSAHCSATVTATTVARKTHTRDIFIFIYQQKELNEYIIELIFKICKVNITVRINYERVLTYICGEIWKNIIETHFWLYLSLLELICTEIIFWKF